MALDLKTYPRTDGQDGDNVHVIVYQPLSVKARRISFSVKDILKFTFT